MYVFSVYQSRGRGLFPGHPHSLDPGEDRWHANPSVFTGASIACALNTYIPSIDNRLQYTNGKTPFLRQRDFRLPYANRTTVFLTLTARPFSIR